MPSPPAHAAKRSKAQASRGLPVYALYGEAGSPSRLDLHIETIHARSSRLGWEIASHRHAGLHQVLWLASGQVDARLDQARASHPAPAVLLVPSGVAHAFRFQPDSTGSVLTFNPAVLAQHDADAAGAALAGLFDQPRVLGLADAPDEAAQLQRLVDALTDEWRRAERDPAGSPPGSVGMANPSPAWLARSIVWLLARRAQVLPGQALARRAERRATPAAGRRARHPAYTRWVVLVEAHHRAHWPVSRYADQLGLSTERLNRLVRAESGLSALAFIHDRLAREACRLLAHVAAPVSQLGFELGFDDPAYFCRFVKRVTGLAPQAYRRALVQAQTPDPSGNGPHDLPTAAPRE